MNETIAAIVSIFTAVIGVAIISVLVSQNSQTPSVIQSLFGGFGNLLNSAMSPVTGNH